MLPWTTLCPRDDLIAVPSVSYLLALGANDMICKPSCEEAPEEEGDQEEAEETVAARDDCDNGCAPAGGDAANEQARYESKNESGDPEAAAGAPAELRGGDSEAVGGAAADREPTTAADEAGTSSVPESLTEMISPGGVHPSVNTGHADLDAEERRDGFAKGPLSGSRHAIACVRARPCVAWHTRSGSRNGLTGSGRGRGSTRPVPVATSKHVIVGTILRASPLNCSGPYRCLHAPHPSPPTNTHTHGHGLAHGRTTLMHKTI